MKVLYLVHQFYPEYYTGTEKFVLNMAMMMQMLGHKVKVVTYSFYGDSFYDRSDGSILIKEFLYKGIPVVALRHKEIPGDLGYGLQNKDMAEAAESLISNEKPDIVHVGHSMRVGEFVKVVRSFGIPYIATLTDFWLLCPKAVLFTSEGDLCAGAENGDACRKLCPEIPGELVVQRIKSARGVLFDAKRVVSPSRFVSSMFRREIRDLNVGIVNHGMSYGKIKKNKKVYKKQDRLTFFYGGSFNHHKGVHVLIDAFKRVTADGVSLKVYGSGTDQLYVDAIKDVAKDDKRIEFCSVFSENQIGDILANVDVVIVPSLWYENYPLVLHESLACNVPVIASNVGGMAEKIKNGINGFTFQLGKSGHLKETLEMLINNPEILNVLKNNIKNYIIPTVEQEAYVYEKEYKSIYANQQRNS
ncbi:MAG TPA: glycosyltransferase [Nitrospirae bacterium]|nr:glycogen synthase [bacterium BMS3Abin08]HDH53500.1 glycosyltransferase [Nitrospirota bacterium]HDZ61696.1 glycosyltransferase [Nitrospirota bacterium]